ncbi:substrate-binding periplasmic protein [Mesorhizobium sp. NPDC059025]|uniref:substrate-binding periplasmic protein n=1 Tax=unclassified Mesorhizobium TaxID=325217 RepID=UPI00367FA900
MVCDRRATGTCLGIALCVLMAVLLSKAALASERYQLSEPGTLSVAITGDMPGLVALDGKLSGYDGEILQMAATRLGLKIRPVPMEWSGAIAATQSGQVDIIGGNVAWTRQRADVLIMTDPTAYFQNGITQKIGQNWNSLADLENKKVGSMIGFGFLVELRRLPGLQLMLYDTPDAAMRDLVIGRIDAMIGDPPAIDYAISRNPGWKLHTVPFIDNNPDFPLLTSTGRQYVFGLSRNNQALADDLSREIRLLWSDCKVRLIGRHYGLLSNTNFVPSADNFRAGVDRPADWAAPRCRQ